MTGVIEEITRPSAKVAETALSGLQQPEDSKGLIADKPDPQALNSGATQRLTFFAADGVALGYELEVEYPAFEAIETDQELVARVTFRANGNQSDPFLAYSSGHSDVLSGIDKETALGVIDIEREMPVADFVELKNRLTAIEEFSWEYPAEDFETLRNVGRAFSQLFRSAALTEDVSELLASTPLGNMKERQF